MNRPVLYLVSGLLAGGFLAVVVALSPLGTESHVESAGLPGTAHQEQPAEVEHSAPTPLRSGARAVLATLRPSPAPPEPAAAPPRDEAADEMVRRLRTENESLRQLTRELQDQLSAVFAWMIDNYKGRYPLRESQITNLQFRVLSESYELNPAVAEFMNLTPEDVTAVNELLYYGVDAIDELIRARMVVTDSGGGRITVHVPPFAREGAQVREDIYFGLEATLGAGRFDRFMDVTGGKFEEEFHYFGNASHTIVMEPAVSPDGRQARWLLRDGWVIQDSPTTTVIRATETVLDDLPEWYYDLR